MDQSLSNKNQLPERNQINAEMIADTVNQIEKDLGLGNLIVGESDKASTPFDQIFEALLPQVENFLLHSPASLPQHLYQVDLPEKMANRALASDQPAQLLTEFIIKRCFQKVVLRRMHRSGNI